MRSEEEMYRLLLETAKADDRILAVYMNGSRTNPKVSKDIFQDYDIVYVVTNESIDSMNITYGSRVSAFCKASSVLIVKRV